MYIIEKKCVDIHGRMWGGGGGEGEAFSPSQFTWICIKSYNQSRLLSGIVHSGLCFGYGARLRSRQNYFAPLSPFLDVLMIFFTVLKCEK